MKKLILSAALVLGSLTTFAQTGTAKPATATTTTTTTTTTQDSYKEITTAEVPEAVKAALTKAYPTAKLDKAYVNEAKQYKLEVTVGEKKGSLVADANGNWIQQ